MSAAMNDPRVAELLEYEGAVDEAGQPTPLAMIAARVKSYLEAVGKLREDLAKYHSNIEKLEVRADNLAKSLDDRKEQSTDLKVSAQEAAVRAAYLTTSRSANLRKDAEAKHRSFKQSQEVTEQDAKRLKEVMRALENNRKLMTDTRDQIARRMNIIDTLLDRAEIEWPSHYKDENKRLKRPTGRASAAQPARRRRRGGPARRIIVRRKAS